MTNAILVGWSIVVVVLWVALLTMPRWVVRSLGRHRLWRHRDRVVNMILSGHLPDHPAVYALLEDIESAIRMSSDRSLYRNLSAARAIRKLSPDAYQRWKDIVSRPSPKGLTDPELRLLEEYRERLRILHVGTALLGSWLGLVIVATKIPSQVRTMRSARRSALSAAADDAARHSRLGERLLPAADMIYRVAGPALVNPA